MPALTAPNTGVIQFDDVTPGASAVAEQTITDVAWGDEFVVKGANFTGDTATLVGTALTVKDASNATVFTMDDVSLQPGFTGTFVASGDAIEAVCYARGTMIRTPAGDPAPMYGRGAAVRMRTVSRSRSELPPCRSPHR